MAFSELIKNFNDIREYMREFYVNGFKTREEFSAKSLRSYDDERRRIESWLDGYMRFRTDNKGKNVFISIDSRNSKSNPLYKAWKTKKFTDGDITFHFAVFELLYGKNIWMSINDIQDALGELFSDFDEPLLFDDSTIRKKLKEYIAEGMIVSRKNGKKVEYSCPSNISYEDLNNMSEALEYFSEVSPCGVIGSFITDKLEMPESDFSYKHHYITSSLDSEILNVLFKALNSSSSVVVNVYKNDFDISLVPLKVYISVQTGRQYVISYDLKSRKYSSIRIDHIEKALIGSPCEKIDEYKCFFEKEIAPFMWGVSLNNYPQKERVEFTLEYKEDEPFIHQRLLREGRNGTITKLDATHSKFVVEVFDSREIFPWVRTFIGRISDVSFSNSDLQKLFIDDIREMQKLYFGGDV